MFYWLDPKVLFLVLVYFIIIAVCCVFLKPLCDIFTLPFFLCKRHASPKNSTIVAWFFPVNYKLKFLFVLAIKTDWNIQLVKEW